MRAVRRSDRGLSEIVGTLMLIVIVVSAATLLAAFVASYQKTLQSQEAYTHDQSLESIKILGLATSLNSNGSAYSNITFRLADESVEASTITGIAINNVVLFSYTWEDLGNQTWWVCSLSSGCALSLSPQQQVVVSTDKDSFQLGAPPLPNQYLKIDAYTDYQNDFSRAFLPPVAQAVVSQQTYGGTTYDLLDGSNSFQPEGNASILDWSWNVNGGGDASIATTLPGTFQDNATLAVANGDLFNGTVTGTGATATFNVPSGFTWTGTESIEFTPGFGENLTVSQTGGRCAIGDSTVTAGSVTATYPTSATMQLTFSFTTVISECTAKLPNSAALAFASGGVTLTMIPEPVLANGEEAQLPVVLPVPPTMFFWPEYNVTLFVINTDGLVGSTTVSFTPGP